MRRKRDEVTVTGPPAKPSTAAGDLRATLGILVALGVALFGVDRKVNALRVELAALDERADRVLEHTTHAQAIAAGVAGAPPLPLGNLAGFRLEAHGEHHERMTLDDLAAHLLDVHGADPATPAEGWAQLHDLHGELGVSGLAPLAAVDGGEG